MEIAAKPIDDQKEWEAVVKEAGGHALHLPIHWIQGIDKGEPLGIRINHGADIVGATLAYTTSGRLPSFLGGKRSLILPTSPAILAQWKDNEEIYPTLMEWARTSGYSTLSIYPAWGDDFSFDEVLSQHITDTVIDFTIDLTQGMETVHGGIHKKHRKNIRRAKESGVIIEEDNSLQAFLRLREFQNASRQRSEERGNIYQLQSEDYFRKIYRNGYDNGPGRILHARIAQDYLASLAYLPFGKKAVTVRSGSVRLGYELGAFHFLQFELIRLLLEEGFTDLNIGGVPAGAQEPSHKNYGLYTFKRYFGGQKNIRTGLQVPLT